ncbi:PEP-CTERM sorting domain-containing protein [Rubritalea tangerina]|uniref:PEP-CTERM sorting domain-containing protein n=1 Tax=Rubritalea tangerina TaxID=430798 RepID=A0ABW4ZC09_9BACT
MKITNTSILTTITAIGLSIGAHAATLATQTFAVNTTVNEFYFLDEATATWTINSGVTVTGDGTERYYLGRNNVGANDVPANWIVNGGGTLEIVGTTFRLGHQGTSEVGTLTIQGGSSVLMTAEQASVQQQKEGSFIALEGVGSTFQWYGTWDAVNNEVESAGGSGNHIPLSASGGTLSISSADGFTTATVVAVPEPSASALVGLGGMALILRRRK